MKCPVRRAIELERLQHAEPLRPSIVDPHLAFVDQVLEQHPRLRATRIHQMIRDRGYPVACHVLFHSEVSGKYNDDPND